MFNYSIKQHILFILTISIWELTFSQSHENVMQFAHDSYQRGQYAVALKEYQRALFFAEDKTNPDLFSSVADCYFNVGDLNRAREFYDRAYFLFDSDSMRLTTFFNKVACNVFQKNYDLALIDMFGLPDTLSPFFEKRKQFYLGIIYFGKEDFEKSKNHFLNIHRNNKAYIDKVQDLYDPRGKINRPNPKTAFILSLIIPGTGQFYAGDFKSGINSFVLNEGLLLLGIYTAYRYTILDALVSVGPWFQRYYQGGLESAEKIAEHKRAKHRQQVFEQLMETVEERREN